MYERIRADDGLVTLVTWASAAMNMKKITLQANNLMQYKVYADVVL